MLFRSRIYVGNPVSGSRRVITHLFKANGVDAKTATLIDEDFPEDAAPLFDGKADAAILILPPEIPRIQSLMRNPKLQLMDFAAEADAYVNRFPSLTKVVLRQGAVEFDPEIPPADITLLSTSVALVVRTTLDPALASLLAAVILNHETLGDALSYQLARKLGDQELRAMSLRDTVEEAYEADPSIVEMAEADLKEIGRAHV